MTILQLPAVCNAPFTMAEVGARDTPLDRAIAHAFPQLQVIGFEPDIEECRRLELLHGEPHRFFPVAVGARTEMRTFYRARYPWYSSLLLPDHELLNDYWEGVLRFGTAERAEISVVDLDTFLPQHGVDTVDFWQLDIQGGEMKALIGARGLLAGSLLGLRVEVSFQPMYAGQPLFGDIDAFVRRHGFRFWELYTIPHKLHRRGLPPSASGGGQIASGDALYLRDHRHLLQSSQLLPVQKLAVLASALGFHDYAAEIAQDLLASPFIGSDAPVLSEAIKRYVSRLTQR